MSKEEWWLDWVNTKESVTRQSQLSPESKLASKRWPCLVVCMKHVFPLGCSVDSFMRWFLTDSKDPPPVHPVRRGKAASVQSVTRGPSLSTCAYVQHIPACVYFRTKTLILTRSTRPRQPELRADRTALSPSTFPSQGQRGQENSANSAVRCPSALNYQQETSFTEQEVLFCNWPAMIQ